MWGFNDDKYISICNEINKNLEWYHNDNWEEEDNGKNFKAFNGESEGIIQLVYCFLVLCVVQFFFKNQILIFYN